MTDTTDRTKPVAMIMPRSLEELQKHSWESATVYSADAKHRFVKNCSPLYGPSLRSEYERVKAENTALAAHACIFLDGSGVTGDEHGNSICLVTRRSEALEAEVKRLREALNRNFCVMYLDGINEHGTHVLPSYPRNFEISDDDISDQADIIWRDAHMLGFKEGDLVWCDFTYEPAQIGDFGRVELADYWEYSAINKDLSTEINKKARAVLEASR